MLSSKYRFHSRGGVKYTYRHGKTLRRPAISLVFNDNERGATRFAVVISKKVIKSAVGRNRVRRRVYEAIRADFDKIKPARDYVFVIYDAKVKDMSFDSLRALIRSLVEECMLQ